jgi:D-arabinan exo alpha-(1,3)/(1,5)-arabinofuranosidase (non-reducing end)
MRFFTVVLLALLMATSISMAAPFGPLDGLASIDADFTTQRSSSYNPTGENRDWWWMEPGQTQTLLQVDGSGIVNHIWMTNGTVEARYSSRLVLRMYWDGNDYPSVEAPVGDFFGTGFGYLNPFHNALFEVSAEGRAYNCFIPMPFAKGARVTLTNESKENRCRVFFYVDYQKYKKLPRGLGRFHAQYRQQFPCENGNFPIVETTGKGRYLGCHLSCRNNKNGWMGEGDDMIYIDGSPTPTLYGTGTEDYFSDAWCFREFQHPSHGLSLYMGDKFTNSVHTAYRYHVQDPIVFKKSIKVGIEHGTQNNRTDDWAAVGFWYQERAVSVAGTLPKTSQRLIKYPHVLELGETITLEGEELIGKVIAAGGKMQAQELKQERVAGVSGGKQLLFSNRHPNGRISLLMHSEKSVRYRLQVRFSKGADYGIWQAYFNSKPIKKPLDLYSEKLTLSKWVNLGSLRVEKGESLLEFRCKDRNGFSDGRVLGIDAIRLIKR